MIESLTTIANRHDFNTTFTAEYDTNQSAVTIVTPTSGKQIKVTGVTVSCEGATAATNHIVLKFVTSGDTVVKVHPGTGVFNLDMPNLLSTGAVNEVLSLESNLGANKSYFISVRYREE